MPSRYAPGSDADVGPHPNRFEATRGLFRHGSREIRRARLRLTCHHPFALAEGGIYCNYVPTYIRSYLP
jgi:hypothetical protein